MKFGIIPGPIFPGDWTAQQMYEQIHLQAQTAYQNNFEGLFAGHHYLLGPVTALFQPFPVLSHLLGQFPGMYIGTSIFLLPFHHPVEVAEQTACLDIFSRGKFLFGVGQGYRDIEFRSFGVEKARRRQRMVEGIQTIRKLWTEDNVYFDGKFFSLSGVTINPKPLQRPGPPVFIGADEVGSVSRVPEIGDYWVVSPRHSKIFLREALPRYKATLEQQGRPFKGLPMIRELCVATRTAEAEERIKAAFEEMYHLYHRWGQPGERYDLSFDELKRERLVVGSPKEVAEQIMSYHEEFGAEFMWFRLYWPGMRPEWAIETIHLFGKEVIPQIKQATPLTQIP